MITRTINSTLAEVLCADAEKGELVPTQITLGKSYGTDEALLSAVKKACKDLGLIFVKLTGYTVTEKLYGISEELFMEHATEYPPRPKKEEKEEDK